MKIGNKMFPSNVISTDKVNREIDNCFLIPKPDKREKGNFNFHKTVKPVRLCEYIIKLTTHSEDALVFDPFAGSGTTLVAAKRLKRNYLGIDINKEYVEIANKRLEDTHIAEDCHEVFNLAPQYKLHNTLFDG